MAKKVREEWWAIVLFPRSEHPYFVLDPKGPGPRPMLFGSRRAALDWGLENVGDRPRKTVRVLVSEIAKRTK